MRVDSRSDIVCPWCYIGRRRFEKALAGFEHRDQIEVVHHSFQLDTYAATASRLGASGMPFFVIDMRYGVSGAQPTELFHPGPHRSLAIRRPHPKLSTAMRSANRPNPQRPPAGRPWPRRPAARTVTTR